MNSLQLRIKLRTAAKKNMASVNVVLPLSHVMAPIGFIFV